MDAASSVVIAAVEGFTLTPEEEAFFKNEGPAGVTLFRRNIPQDDYPRVLELNAKLQALRPSGAPPMIIAIDQEGGRVSRIGKPFPNQGPALQVAEGRSDVASLNHLQCYGYDVGQELARIGINVNFAPVLDVLSEESNTAIGDRVFGLDAESVRLRAGAFLEGLQEAHVKGCLKHFPGQGAATVDTHLGQAVIDVGLPTLWERDIAPFRHLVSKASMVMMSHSIFPALCDDEASRSEKIIHDWLRGRLGFRGVVVSDDMNMGALPQQIQEWQEVLIESIAAGCDALLVCRHLDRCVAAVHALRREAQKSPAFRVRLEDAAHRVTELRQQL